MIYNYDDFLLESQMTLILESAVRFTSDFKRILSKIESPVAREIINLAWKDIPVTSNFFDISNTAEEITFIPDKKAQAYTKLRGSLVTAKREDMTDKVKNIYNKLKIDDANYLDWEYLTQETPIRITGKYKPTSDEVTSEGGYFLSITEFVNDETYYKLQITDERSYYNGKEFFLPESKLDFNIDTNELLNDLAKLKQTIRIGRGVRALLKAAGKSFTDKEIEDFVARYKAAWQQDSNIENFIHLIEGDEIAYWYNVKNYRFADSKGTLGNSCMRRAPVSFFDIYVDNPEVCKMLILKSKDDETKILARALVWTLSKPEVTFMDRVYYSDASEYEVFKKYAHDKGWYYKSHNSSTEHFILLGKDDTINEICKVSIKPHNYESYPYMDSLKFINCTRGFLTNDRDANVDYRLESTSGEAFDVYEECERCGGSGSIYCLDCDGDGKVTCSDCNGTAEINCSNCDGNSSIDCETCSASGKVENSEGEEVDCDDCEGKGYQGCRDCEETGKQECQNCFNGKETCHNCDGSGEITCRNCDGTGRQN